MNELDFKDLIKQRFNEYYLEDLKSALDGLTEDERRFQVSAESNHIDFIVWQRDRWHERLGLPERETGGNGRTTHAGVLH